ncbi:MAG: CpsB/CapC family capsule biosynthesis tyrosine phosphatase [Polyangia bacterium]
MEDSEDSVDPPAAPAAGYHDLHAHLIAGVDDGAESVEESHAMLDGLAGLGYSRVAATPHFSHPLFGSPPRALVEERVADLVRERGEALPLLVPGAEIHITEDFRDSAAARSLPAYGQTTAHLVEFAFQPGSIPDGIEQVFFEMQVRGGIVVVAHVERYPDVQRSLQRVESLRRTAVIQVNLMSVIGKYGPRPRNATWKLLEKGLVDVLATDLHRAADLPDVARALSEIADWDSEQLERLVSANPSLLLDGRGSELERDE